MVPEPLPVRVSALPVIRPLASRQVVWDEVPVVGRVRAGDPAAGVPVLGAGAPASVRAGRRGTGDPSRGIAGHRPLGSAGLFVALDGLDDPPVCVAHLLPAGLGGKPGSQGERKKGTEEEYRHGG